MTVGCADVVPADPLAVAAAERAEPQRRGVQAAAEQQVRHGADPDRVVAALDRLGEGPVEVLERLTRAGADVPGEVPQRDGQPLRQVRGLAGRGCRSWQAPGGFEAGRSRSRASSWLGSAARTASRCGWAGVGSPRQQGELGSEQLDRQVAASLRVVVEQQQRRQRGGEVVDRGRVRASCST